MAVARRLYAYGVALIAYLAGLAGLNALIHILDQSRLNMTAGFSDTALYTVGFGDFYRDSLASNGGLLLVAAPIFLFHWNFAQSLARRSPDEAGAGMRKFFLYAALITAMIYGITAFHRLFTGMGMLALGDTVAESDIWPIGGFHAAAVILLSFALVRYWVAMLLGDGDYGAEAGMAGFWRRLYQTGAGLISLGLIIAGGAGIINTVWQIFTGFVAETAGHLWWRAQLIDGLALLLIGGYLLRLNWRQWQHICRTEPAERSRGLRRFYLYAAVVIGALATLVPAAGLLQEGLLILLRGAPGDRWALLDGLGQSISLIPLGFAVWTWHWRYLRVEESAAPESTESATIRRVYYYAVAATGLALFWFGAVEIVQAGLDRVLSPASAIASDYWIERLAWGLSLLMVGAPIWAIHWRAVERIARRADEQGLYERASGPRRAYLYGVALVGALLILAFLAQVAYRGFLLVLGAPDAGFFSPQAAGELARSVIAAALWIVHILAIRTDSRMGTNAPRTTSSERADQTGTEQTRTGLESRIRKLETELETARRELAALAEREKDSHQEQ